MASQKQPDYRINLRWYRIFYWPFMLPIALLLALFNKISPVPFKIYPLRIDRVGHMSVNQEQFLCEMEHGLYPKEFRVYVHRDRPANSVMLDILKRVMPVRQILLPLFDVCHKMGGLGVSSMDLHNSPGEDWNYLIYKTPQHMFLSETEEQEARKQCKELGIDPNSPFIPVLGRDSSYLSHLGEPTDEMSYRNVDINTFIPAMEHLADRFQVIRMGSIVKDKLKTNHPNILDYSFSGKRTELLDVYFSAKCHFFLSCGTGLDSITSTSFRLPVLYVNYIPPSIVPYFRPGSMFILKKYWHTKEKRYLGLNELFENHLGDAFSPSTLNPIDIVVHDNSPEEIKEVASEMTARLDGTWIETKEDKDLQKQFKAIYKKHFGDFQVLGRIGSKFLKDNSYWLK